MWSMKWSSWKINESKSQEMQENLKINKIYNISSVIQNVHVIFSEFERYYVNNYVNWDTYNTIYDEKFLKSEIARVNMYKKSCL